VVVGSNGLRAEQAGFFTRVPVELERGRRLVAAADENAEDIDELMKQI
jgi:hypothetical protein